MNDAIGLPSKGGTKGMSARGSIRRRVAVRGAALALLGCLLSTTAASASSGDQSRTPGTYRIVDSIPAPNALWDLASINPQRHRLYVGRVGGVLAVDLRTRVVSPAFVPSGMVHGALPLGDSGRAVATNGLAATAVIFDETTGRVLSTVPTGEDPDAIVVEPRSGLVVITDEKGADLTLIDPLAGVAVGSIPLGGAPDFPAVDGRGLVYVNINSKNEIAVVDVAKRAILRRLALPGCEGPTGLAYDAADRLLLTVCENGAVLFLDAEAGRVLQSFHVGAAPDAVLFDAARRRAFVPSGADGVLTIFSVRGRKRITIRQRLLTQVGVRLGALDPLTGRLYLPAAQIIPPKAPGQMKSLVPNTFRILVVAPD
jgi:DNA-binding beta-propeller fold protein YncE